MGFGSIGVLSSVLAKIQGFLFPTSMQLFEQTIWTSDDIIQLIIKLVCVYVSCITGGIVTALFGGEKRQLIIVGISIMSVIIWLWIIVIHPLWFWALLLAGIIPFILIGNKIKQTFLWTLLVSILSIFAVFYRLQKHLYNILVYITILCLYWEKSVGSLQCQFTCGLIIKSTLNPKIRYEIRIFLMSPDLRILKLSG